MFGRWSTPCNCSRKLEGRLGGRHTRCSVAENNLAGAGPAFSVGGGGRANELMAKKIIAVPQRGFCAFCVLLARGFFFFFLWTVSRQTPSEFGRLGRFFTPGGLGGLATLGAGLEEPLGQAHSRGRRKTVGVENRPSQKKGTRVPFSLHA